MLDFIMGPLIVGIITLGIYKLFELFVCKRERLAIIEKLGDKFIMPTLDKLHLPNYSQARISSGALKGGCLLMGVGLGLLIGFIICMNAIPNYFSNARNWDYREVAGIVYGSCVLLCGGIGLITAFMIEMRIGKKDKNV